MSNGIWFPTSDLRESEANSAQQQWDEQIARFSARWMPQQQPAQQQPQQPAQPEPWSVDRSGLMPWLEQAASGAATAAGQAASSVASGVTGLFDRKALMPWIEKPSEPQPSAVPGSRPTAPSGTPAAMPQGLAMGGQGEDEPLGEIVEGDPDGFFRTAGAYARRVERETGVPAALTLAIAANETGYGQRRYMAGSNNYHGLQADPNDPSGTPYVDWRVDPTTGQKVSYAARQQGFATPLDGFRAFARTLTSSPRYAPALARYQQDRDIDALVAGIHAAGYAEDPEYTRKITSIIRGIPVPTGVGEVTDTRGVPLRSQQQQRPTSAADAPERQGTWGTDLTPDQAALDDPDKWALCGPVAAVAMARARGGNWTVAQAKQYAQQNGLWNPQQGMGGLEAEAKLLRGMGYAAKTGPKDWNAIIADVGSGNPVSLSTTFIEGGHYVVLEQYDPKTGKFKVGGLGNVLKKTAGRGQWYSPAELDELGGINGALYFDSPATPAPSPVATGRVALNAPSDAPPDGATQPASGAPPPAPGAGAPPAPTFDGRMAYTGAGGGSSDVTPYAYQQQTGAPAWTDDGYSPTQIQTTGAPPPVTSSYNDPTDGGTQTQPLPTPVTSTYNDPTTTGTQQAPLPAYVPPRHVVEDQPSHPLPPQQVAYPRPADDPGGAVQRAQDAQSTPLPYDNRRDDEGRREAVPGSIGASRQVAPTFDETPDPIGSVVLPAVRALPAAAQAAGRAYGQAVTRGPNALETAAGVVLPAPAAAAVRGIGIYQDVQGAAASEIGRAVDEALAGPEDEVVGTVLGQPVTRRQLAEMIAQGILDPSNFLPVGQAKPAARAIGRGVTEAVDAARPVVREGVEAAGRGLRGLAGDAPEMRPGVQYLGSGVVPDAGRAGTDAAPTFYSQLRRVIEEKMPNRAAPGQVQGIIRNGQVKPDEITWTGIDDWLREQKGPVTKQQVLEFLDQNEVRVEEVVKGGKNRSIEAIDAEMDALHRQGDILTDPALRQRYDDLMTERTNVQYGTTGSSATKYGQYTLPGGENYRELLITLPESANTRSADAAAQALEAEVRALGLPENTTPQRIIEAGGSQDLATRWYRYKVSGDVGTPYESYRSPHWDEPNVLAHVRFNDRTGPNGERILLVEEVQSDWHQAGRKQGYQRPIDLSDWTIASSSGRQHTVVRPDGQRFTEFADTPEEAIQIAAGRQGMVPRRDGVPDAPFQKTWPELAMKRMIRWAAENGYDRIAWPLGQVHAERYSLERHIGDLRWEREASHWSDPEPMWSLTARSPEGAHVFSENRVTASRMADLVGQETAAKITGAAESSGRFAGQDLRVGGEGMRGFYDQILPSVAQKLGKKFGAQVGSVDVRTARGETQTAHSLDITPAMRESVMQQGQALFSGVGVSTQSGLRPTAYNAAQGAVFGGYAPTDSGEIDEDERGRRMLAGAVLGVGAGRLAARGGALRAGERLAGSGFVPANGGVPPNVRRFASPAAALEAAESAIGKPAPRGPSSGLKGIEGVRRWLVRNATDNRVDLAELQKEAQRALGRPLQYDEMVLELSRVNPSGSAKVMIDDAIRPVLQGIDEPERKTLSTLMMLLNNADVAAATGNPNRQFSGGLTGADSQAAGKHLWDSLAPEVQERVGKAGDALYQVVAHYRDEMVRAGVWTPELAADLAEKYPHWMPTKILDYMADPATVTTGQRGISLRDRGLRRYTFDGTAREREDPIASLVRYVQDAEAIVQKNEVFNAFANLRERVPGWSDLIREVPSGTAAAVGRGEKTVTGFVNGERKTFVVPAPMAAAIQMDQGQQVPILRQLTQVFRELITRTPMFVAGQIQLDAFAYTVRETAREGGPQALPRVLAELGKGYAEAFKGLLDGSFQGDAARYLREGGGMAGFYERAADAASKTVDDLTRRNMLEVRNAADMQKLVRWMLTGGWVHAVGSRVEMAPRVAAFRLGERRAARAGAGAETAALQGMVGGRDVTLDFARGGTAAKVLNQVIPFFNVGVQSATTLPRMLRENPKGTAVTLLSLVAGPTMAAEAWNQSDPQRAQDYADVPDYVKDRGIVIMLPGVEGRDERGERRPNYALIPLRELAPVAILSRELMQRAMGTSGRPATETAQAILGAASPVQASGAADLFSSVVPPGMSTALQLATDRDFFRGGPIATERRDENASALARAGVGAWNAVTGRQDRPSQADFAIRDLTGGVGAMASAASDLATGRKKDEDRIQSAPVVGGLVSRFVGDAVGGNLNRARDTMLTPEVTRVLREAGMRDDEVKAAPPVYKGARLTREEQARWQESLNTYLADEILQAQEKTAWDKPERREQLVRDAVSKARERAAKDALGDVNSSERRERIERERNRKAG